MPIAQHRQAHGPCYVLHLRQQATSVQCMQAMQPKTDVKLFTNRNLKYNYWPSENEKYRLRTQLKIEQQFCFSGVKYH